MEYTALYFEKKGNNKVKCRLCRHRCLISDTKVGICGVRQNKGGNLISLVYGKPISGTVDPIEKKPLFHFYPGSRAFSLATVGCNFRCLHCQNWQISQSRNFNTQYISPDEIVRSALAQNADGMSYTYTEPTVFYEYAYDIAKIAAKSNLYNTFVTNGYIEEDPLREISPYIGAANIDVKGFNGDFYKKVCAASLEEVLSSTKIYYELGIHIELTYLLIPTYNDTIDEITSFISWVKKELSDEIPLHFSRFHPDYKLKNSTPTDFEVVKRAQRAAFESGMKYVYCGNMRGYEDTFCPNCKTTLIKRSGFFISDYRITDNRTCPDCGEKINIVL